MPFKVIVNQGECIGCGACAAQCDNFEIVEVGGEMKAKVKQDKVSTEGCNKEAADICPVTAIKLSQVK